MGVGESAPEGIKAGAAHMFDLNGGGVAGGGFIFSIKPLDLIFIPDSRGALQYWKSGR